MGSRDSIYAHEISDSKRKSRNLSEKKRRDAFNSLVTELAVLVTGVERRLDKSNVLKQTIAFLKKHNQLPTECITGSEEADYVTPNFLSVDEYFRYFLESAGAFIFAVDISDDGDTARISYVSDDAGNRFGSPTVVGYLRSTSFFEILSKHDEKTIREELRRFARSSIIDEHSRNDTNTEFVRFQCVIPGKSLAFLKNEPETEMSDITLKVTGRFKRMNSSSKLLICLAKIIGFDMNDSVISPLNSLASAIEFSSKMDVEWKFIEVDPRVVNVLGYQPIELLGNSGYDFCHPDDLEQFMESQRQMKSCTDGTTASYRLRTKWEKYVWIRTRYYVTYQEWDSKPECIVCMNVLVNRIDDNGLSIGGPGVVPMKNKAFSSDKKAANISATGLPQLQETRHVFRPQPGVSIEHVPLSTLGSKPPPAKKPKDLSHESTFAQADMDISAVGQMNEKMLWELLEKRQSNLQEKIQQHQQELKRLQDQLFSSIPLLVSPALSSSTTIETDLTSPVSSNLSPAARSISSVGIQGTNVVDWRQYPNRTVSSCIVNPNSGFDIDVQVYNNGMGNTYRM